MRANIPGTIRAAIPAAIPAAILGLVVSARAAAGGEPAEEDVSWHLEKRAIDDRIVVERGRSP